MLICGQLGAPVGVSECEYHDGHTVFKRTGLSRTLRRLCHEADNLGTKMVEKRKSSMQVST